MTTAKASRPTAAKAATGNNSSRSKSNDNNNSKSNNNNKSSRKKSAATVEVPNAKDHANEQAVVELQLPMVWVTQGITDHAAYILRIADDGRKFVKWVASSTTQWVAADAVIKTELPRRRRQGLPSLGSGQAASDPAKVQPAIATATAAQETGKMLKKAEKIPIKKEPIAKKNKTKVEPKHGKCTIKENKVTITRHVVKSPEPAIRTDAKVQTTTECPAPVQPRTKRGKKSTIQNDKLTVEPANHLDDNDDDMAAKGSSNMSSGKGPTGNTSQPAVVVADSPRRATRATTPKKGHSQHDNATQKSATANITTTTDAIGTTPTTSHRKTRRARHAAAETTPQHEHTHAKFAIGTQVYKEFPPYGWFTGKVISYDGEVYKIRYEDDDAEELEESELAPIVVVAPTDDKNSLLPLKQNHMEQEPTISADHEQPAGEATSSDPAIPRPNSTIFNKDSINTSTTTTTTTKEYQPSAQQSEQQQESSPTMEVKFLGVDVKQKSLDTSSDMEIDASIAATLLPKILGDDILPSKMPNAPAILRQRKGSSDDLATASADGSTMEMNSTITAIVDESTAACQPTQSADAQGESCEGNIPTAVCKTTQPADAEGETCEGLAIEVLRTAEIDGQPLQPSNEPPCNVDKSPPKAFDRLGKPIDNSVVGSKSMGTRVLWAEVVGHDEAEVTWATTREDCQIELEKKELTEASFEPKEDVEDVATAPRHSASVSAVNASTDDQNDARTEDRNNEGFDISPPRDEINGTFHDGSNADEACDHPIGGQVVLKIQCDDHSNSNFDAINNSHETMEHRETIDAQPMEEPATASQADVAGLSAGNLDAPRTNVSAKNPELKAGGQTNILEVGSLVDESASETILGLTESEPAAVTITRTIQEEQLLDQEGKVSTKNGITKEKLASDSAQLETLDRSPRDDAGNSSQRRSKIVEIITEKDPAGILCDKIGCPELPPCVHVSPTTSIGLTLSARDGDKPAPRHHNLKTKEVSNFGLKLNDGSRHLQLHGSSGVDMALQLTPAPTFDKVVGLPGRRPAFAVDPKTSSTKKTGTDACAHLSINDSIVKPCKSGEATTIGISESMRSASESANYTQSDLDDVQDITLDRRDASDGSLSQSSSEKPKTTNKTRPSIQIAPSETDGVTRVEAPRSTVANSTPKYMSASPNKTVIRWEVDPDPTTKTQRKRSGGLAATRVLHPVKDTSSPTILNQREIPVSERPLPHLKSIVAPKPMPRLTRTLSDATKPLAADPSLQPAIASYKKEPRSLREEKGVNLKTSLKVIHSSSSPVEGSKPMLMPQPKHIVLSEDPEPSTADLIQDIVSTIPKETALPLAAVTVSQAKSCKEQRKAKQSTKTTSKAPASAQKPVVTNPVPHSQSASPEDLANPISKSVGPIEAEKSLLVTSGNSSTAALPMADIRAQHPKIAPKKATNTSAAISVANDMRIHPKVGPKMLAPNMADQPKTTPPNKKESPETEATLTLQDRCYKQFGPPTMNSTSEETSTPLSANSRSESKGTVCEPLMESQNHSTLLGNSRGEAHQLPTGRSSDINVGMSAGNTEEFVAETGEQSEANDEEASTVEIDLTSAKYSDPTKYQAPTEVKCNKKTAIKYTALKVPEDAQRGLCDSSVSSSTVSDYAEDAIASAAHQAQGVEGAHRSAHEPLPASIVTAETAATIADGLTQSTSAIWTKRPNPVEPTIRKEVAAKRRTPTSMFLKTSSTSHGKNHSLIPRISNNATKVPMKKRPVEIAVDTLKLPNGRVRKSRRLALRKEDSKETVADEKRCQEKEGEQKYLRKKSAKSDEVTEKSEIKASSSKVIPNRDAESRTTKDLGRNASSANQKAKRTWQKSMLGSRSHKINGTVNRSVGHAKSRSSTPPEKVTFVDLTAPPAEHARAKAKHATKERADEEILGLAEAMVSMRRTGPATAPQSEGQKNDKPNNPRPRKRAKKTSYGDVGELYPESTCCPICRKHIPALDACPVDWSRPLHYPTDGHAIEAIRLHTARFHKSVPAWNVLEATLGLRIATSSNATDQPSETQVLTPVSYVKLALRHSVCCSYDIDNSLTDMRKLRDMFVRRLGVARGFIQWSSDYFLGGYEIRNCTGDSVSTAELRRLSLLLLNFLEEHILDHAFDKKFHITQALAQSMPFLQWRNTVQNVFLHPDGIETSWFANADDYTRFSLVSYRNADEEMQSREERNPMALMVNGLTAGAADCDVNQT